MIQKFEFGNVTIGPLTNRAGYVITSERGFDFPVVRVGVSDYGNADGAALDSYFYGSRKLSLQGEIWGLDASDYEAKRRALQTACDISGGLKRITITTRAGLVVRGEGIITTTPEMTYKDGVIRGPFRLEIVMPFPFLLGNTIKSQTIMPSIGGGGPVPSPIPFPITGGDESANVLTNDGNVDGYWKATIIGPIETPTLMNATTNQQITFDINLVYDSEWIEIDSRLGTIRDQAGNNVADIAGDNPNFWKLAQGTNQIRLLYESVNGGYAFFNYQDHYLGV